MPETSGSQPPGGSAAWASWVAFGGIMMMLIGVFSVIAGLAAVTDDGYIAGTSYNDVFLVSFKALGFFWIALGVLKAWAGFALIQGREWARIVTIVLVFISAISHMLDLTSQPFLSLLFIVVDLVILYAVTVRWEEAKIGMGD
ncbi:MAG: hypothetical protein J0H98_00385 [Solirubrobacterales bacterium]|nr:hypothetical protein [Solirubrobacterales bacterium]